MPSAGEEQRGEEAGGLCLVLSEGFGVESKVFWGVGSVCFCAVQGEVEAGLFG